MFRPVLFSVLAFSVAAGPAIAQTTSPATPPPSSTTTTPTTSTPNTATQGGLQTAQSGVVALRFVTVKASDALSSRLVGTALYNKQNEKLGDIEDLIIENGKNITGVVVSVGGFLGLGERYVAVDPANILLTREGSDGFRGVLDTNKDNLSKAPAFDYSRRR